MMGAPVSQFGEARFFAGGPLQQLHQVGGRTVLAGAFNVDFNRLALIQRTGQDRVSRGFAARREFTGQPGLVELTVSGQNGAVHRA